MNAETSGVTPQMHPTAANTAHEPTDTELMIQVRNGEIDKLGILFERHHRQFYAFFVRLTSSPALAEDLVQDVFVRLLKYRHTFRGGEFTPWVFRLARNAAADHYGRRRPEDPLPEDGFEPAATAPLASETMVQDQEQARVRVALGRLSPDKRELLLLARFQLLPYDEIARLLDTTAGAVKVRVHRALKDLRRAYLGTKEAPV
jgi:RNA polymerase sigma-70 factor (ECF subfamily)